MAKSSPQRDAPRTNAARNRGGAFGAALLALAGLGAPIGCSRPQAPTLRPERVAIARISPAGVEVKAQLTATNPNAIAINVQSVTTKIRFEGPYELGPVVVAHPLALPPNTPVLVDVPISVKWTDVSGLAQLAAKNRDVTYELDGTVAVGTEKFHFDVPFQAQGVMRRDDLVRAAFQSLPGLLPIAP